MEGIVNCQLSEILPCNVAAKKLILTFGFVDRNGSDLIAYAGPILGYYSHVECIFNSGYHVLEGSLPNVGNQRISFGETMSHKKMILKTSISFFFN